MLNLAEARTTTYQQADLSFTHQFKPGLDWRGTAAGAFYSDQNRRLSLYQGLAWQAIREPRMHLELTPHYYLAAYSQRRQAYFRPAPITLSAWELISTGRFFRLPTLILQGTIQGVSQHGDFGPALQGLAALEWEFVQQLLHWTSMPSISGSGGGKLSYLLPGRRCAGGFSGPGFQPGYGANRMPAPSRTCVSLGLPPEEP